ncbi:very short patch repair endonuclease [Pseudomonas sp. NFACC16-2]|uniref:very short patch repair endonuclease n=2 Tax=Pseudomonas TaxID=286 RepID=UPI003531C8C6
MFMIDTVSSAKRSHIMSLVKGKNTRPEMTVRRVLHAAGFRYRLHDNSLPGKPDIVFAKKRKVIFVHGCFWHRHVGCHLCRMPKTNQLFWSEKFEANVIRDSLNNDLLIASGWSVLTVWECEISDLEHLEKRLRDFLS